MSLVLKRVRSGSECGFEIILLLGLMLRWGVRKFGNS